ncbi:MAG: 30S ribosomal protein S8 [Myxococcales bacterium]|nr:30S ribosomal protein S8 [Myxococcales bacterium]
MSMTDPIGDFLARIRNAIGARKAEVVAPKSKIKHRIAEILRDEGFVDAVTTTDDSVQGTIKVALRYDGRTANAITGLRRVSRPGQRSYIPATDIKRVRNGLGISILSTSQGLMTDREARKRGVGGELLCEIW